MRGLLEKYCDEFVHGRSFDAADAEALLDCLIESSDESALASLFRAWDRKGIEEPEICHIAKILRGRCLKVNSKHEKIVDIVGTGGSKVKTFNVSTAAAFVVAGAGVPVAKHGNKAATSNSGSSDVLNELGIDNSVSPDVAERCLEKIGICFMFAPNHHRLSPTLAKVRRKLGFPTIFNCVGPLCNPAEAKHQLIGVWDRSLVREMANALAKIGTERSWVVHGENGLDEISSEGPTFVAEVLDGRVREFTITPPEIGLTKTGGNPGSIRVSSPKESAGLIRQVIEPNRNEFAARDLVAINAAAAFHLSGHCENVSEAMCFVSDSIRNGHALQKLEALRNFH